MAYMGRGGSPSVGRENADKGTINNLDDLAYMYHRGPFFYRRFYYYIPFDNTYVILQMIAAFIVFTIGAITLIFAYKSTIVDLIESTKKLFLNINLIVIAVFLVTIFVIHYISKDEKTLLRRLIITFIFLLTTTLILFGIKLNLDSTYTEDKFKEFYAEQSIDESTGKAKIEEELTMDFGLKEGISLKTPEEYFVSESVRLYNFFKIKTYATLGLNLLLNVLLIYQISKVSGLKRKKEKLDKDDVVLFDEEENIKI